MTLEANVAQNHHLVIAVDLFERFLQDLGGILAIAGKELFERTHHARRRLDQAFAVGIVAGKANDGAYRGLNLSPLGPAAAKAALQRLQRVQGLQGMDSAVHEMVSFGGASCHGYSTRRFKSCVSEMD
jgi:hypothetical protein